MYNFPMLSRLLLLSFAVYPLAAQPVNPNLYQAMRWRQIGPFRAGRVTAAAGIAGNAAVYYIGTPGAVSYTHLDVYKRQVRVSRGKCEVG